MRVLVGCGLSCQYCCCVLCVVEVGGYSHLSYNFFRCRLFGLVVASDLVLLEAGIALADDSLDLGELARLLLYTHADGCVCVMRGGGLRCGLCLVAQTCDLRSLQCDGNHFLDPYR